MVRPIEKEFEMTEEAYRDMLDELYGAVEICGMSFSSGRALEELDPVAFRCGKSDYESGEPSKWECAECGDVYEEKDDAAECCYVEPPCNHNPGRLNDDGSADCVECGETIPKENLG